MKKQIATFLLCTTFLVSSLHALKRPSEIGDAANKNKTVVVKPRVTPVAKPRAHRVLVKSKARAKSKVAVKRKTHAVKRRAVVLKPKVVAMKRRVVHGKPKAPLKSKTAVLKPKADPRTRAIPVKPPPPVKTKVVPPKRAVPTKAKPIASEELTAENKWLKLVYENKRLKWDINQYEPDHINPFFQRIHNGKRQTKHRVGPIPLPKGYSPITHGEHEFFKEVWKDD